MAGFIHLEGWDFDDYSFRAPVIDVEQIEFINQPLWRIRATVMRIDDEEFNLDIFVTKKVMGEGQTPKIGDDIEGTLWLQGHLSRAIIMDCGILLAEDNHANVKLATIVLGNAGLKVDVAQNGQEAVAKYSASPDLFDLILMDVQMPVMDGLMATRAIREKGFDKVPIIAMTANAMKGDREECQDAGMNDYIPKPIRREIVFEVIKKWTSARSNEKTDSIPEKRPL